MTDGLKKVLKTQFLRTEPRLLPLTFIDPGDGGPSLQVTVAETVKTGTKPDVVENAEGITWVFVEATKDPHIDNRKGYVSNEFLGPEDTVVEGPIGPQPFSEQVDKENFAQNCYLQAVLSKTNPAYLYALAFALSGEDWQDDKVQTSRPGGVFRFPEATWHSLILELGSVGVLFDQIKFPNAQCVVAALVAAKSASLLQGLITDRGLSAVDLMLAHLFVDNESFGSNAAWKILQAEKNDKTQRAEAVIKAEVYPDSPTAALGSGAAAIAGALGSAGAAASAAANVATSAGGTASTAAGAATSAGVATGTNGTNGVMSPAVNGSALRAAFFQRNADIFGADGSATIEQVLKKCTDKLAAGFADIRDVAEKLEAKQDPNLINCQVSGFDGTVAKVPTDPVVDSTVSKVPSDPVLDGSPGPVGAGGEVAQNQHQTRNLRISSKLHDILEYAGRKTGISVDIYSGGQPPTGPHRTGSHRHDVDEAGTLMGAADLHMRDARTGRILDSNNLDDRNRIADFITESAAAGATGIGHAPGYMGPTSTHIGGGTEAVWGAGETRAGAPDWVISAFQKGRRSPLTQSLASALSALRGAPGKINNADTSNVKSLAAVRQRFASELQDREIHRLIAASTRAEVGGQGREAEQYYIESVFNRATARKMTLKQTLTSDARHGGYYPASTIDKLGDPVQPSEQAQIDQIIAAVMAGANASNFATGNESGGVRSGGAAITRDLGPHKERFVREKPDKEWINRAIAAASRGDTNVA